MAVGVALAVTNPAQDAYEAYATEQMADYLATEICNLEVPPALSQIVKDPCQNVDTLIADNRTRLTQLIHDNTVRSNYLLFSLYRTRFEVSGIRILPTYEFQTVGIVNRFFTYQAGKI